MAAPLPAYANREGAVFTDHHKYVDVRYTGYRYIMCECVKEKNILFINSKITKEINIKFHTFTCLFLRMGSNQRNVQFNYPISKTKGTKA